MTKKVLEPKNIVIEKNDWETRIEQSSQSDIKYQDITYHMDNRGKQVSKKEHKHIDFLKAMSEMENLDWTYKNNYIGFENHKTKEYVQFLRQGKDSWYADIPINDGQNWDGYTWSCYAETKPVMGLMRLFFEEVPWFEMLSWKMRRFKH